MFCYSWKKPQNLLFLKIDFTERERDTDVGDKHRSATLGMCPDLELNQPLSGVQDRTTLQQRSHTSQAVPLLFLKLLPLPFLKIAP